MHYRGAKIPPRAALGRDDRCEGVSRDRRREQAPALQGERIATDRNEIEV